MLPPNDLERRLPGARDAPATHMYPSHAPESSRKRVRDEAFTPGSPDSAASGATLATLRTPESEHPHRRTTRQSPPISGQSGPSYPSLPTLADIYQTERELLASLASTKPSAQKTSHRVIPPQPPIVAFTALSSWSNGVEANRLHGQAVNLNDQNVGMAPAPSSVRSGAEGAHEDQGAPPTFQFLDEVTLNSAAVSPGIGDTSMESQEAEGSDRPQAGEDGLAPDSEGKKEQPFSRSPELRVSHKLAERKRRKEMKELFDELRDLLPAERGSKSSKWEILSKAIDYVNLIKKGHIDMTHEVDNLRRELDIARGGTGTGVYPHSTYSAFPLSYPSTYTPAVGPSQTQVASPSTSQQPIKALGSG